MNVYLYIATVYLATDFQIIFLFRVIYFLGVFQIKWGDFILPRQGGNFIHKNLTINRNSYTKINLY